MADHVNQYVDEAAIAKQTDFVLDNLQKIEDRIQHLNDLKIKIEGLTSVKEITTSAAEAAQGIAELEAARKQLAKSTADYDALLKKFADSQKKVADLEKQNIALNIQLSDSTKKVATSYSEMLEKSLANEVETKKLNAALSELKKQYTDGTISLDEFNKQAVPIKSTLQDLRKSTLDTNRSLRNMQQEAASTDGSLEKMRAQLNLARQAFDKLSDVDKAGNVGQSLLENIGRLNAEISKQEQATGRFQRNVGNYGNSLKILEAGLEAVRKKLDAYGKEGNGTAEVIEQLRKEEALLNQILQSQEAGFTKITAQIKANKEALFQMEQAGLDATDAYKNLFAATSALVDSQQDLAASIKNAAPDDVAFNAAADAARGLIGIYGLAQSGAAALGLQNEELEETLVKLQAAETALQSIEAIRALFKKENAFFQALAIAQNKIILAQTWLQGQAESKNIIVRYAAIAAQKALNFVMLASPGAIIAIVATIALLLVSLSSMAAGTEKAGESLEKLNVKLKENARINKELIAAQAAAGEKNIAELEAQYKDEAFIREARIRNMEEQLKIQQRITDADEAAFEKSDALVRARIKSGQKLNKDDEKLIELNKELRERNLQNLEDEAALQRDIDLARIANKKAAHEEFISLTQDEIEALNVSLRTRGEVQKQIADDETKSFDERIEATKRYLQIQERVINNQARSQRLTPGQTPSQIKLIEAERAAAIIAAQKETEKAVQQFQRERDERNKAARLATLQAQLNLELQIADEIARNELKSFDERNKAVNRSFEVRRALLRSQYEAEFADLTLTNTERIELTNRYNLEQQALVIQFGIEQLEIYKANQEAITAAIEAENRKRSAIILAEGDKQIQELNKRRLAGNITQTNYEKERARIESETRKQALAEEIRVATAKVILSREGTAARAEAEAELADKTKQYQDEVLKNAIEGEAQLQALKEQLAGEVLGGLESLISGFYEKSNREIEEQIKLLDERTQKEIDFAEQTIQNANDRAKAIREIEVRAAAQRAALEEKQKQKDLQRAKFEKAINIGKIIAETALAVVHQLSTGDPYTAFARALAVGAIGAVQLIKAITAPLPQYKKGKPKSDNYEGMAVWGDGGKSELRIREDGSMEVGPATPELTYVKKSDVIMPDAQAYLQSYVATPGIEQAHDTTSSSNNGALLAELRALRSMIGKKKPVVIKGDHAGITVMHGYVNGTLQWIEEQTQF